MTRKVGLVSGDIGSCTDWIVLGRRHVAYFANRPSPTEHILDLWEARHRDDDDTSAAVTELANSLRAMGRMDAAAVIDKHLQQPWI